MEINNNTKITYTNYIDIRNNKLVIVQRRITEGYYDQPEVVDLIVGSVLDIMA